MPPLGPWLSAFLFTQAVEVPIYLRPLSGRSWSARVCLAFGASALTHPIVWFTFPELFLGATPLMSRGPSSYWAMVVAAEGFAIVAEALYLRSLGARRSLAWALLANLASVCLGLLSRALLGWP